MLFLWLLSLGCNSPIFFLDDASVHPFCATRLALLVAPLLEASSSLRRLSALKSPELICSCRKLSSTEPGAVGSIYNSVSLAFFASAVLISSASIDDSLSLDSTIARSSPPATTTIGIYFDLLHPQ